LIIQRQKMNSSSSGLSSSSSSSSASSSSSEASAIALDAPDGNESSDFPDLEQASLGPSTTMKSDDHTETDEGEMEGSDESEEDGAGMEEVLQKRQKLLKTQEPIRLQRPSKRKPRPGENRKGTLLAISQAIGGLVCHDCGTRWCRQWVTNLLDGEPTPFCQYCAPYREKRRQKRPATTVRDREFARMRELIYSQHSSWGSMDLIKADPRLISGQHPLSLAPDHLICTPLSLEQASNPGIGKTPCTPMHPLVLSAHELAVPAQAVCLSSAYVGGRNYALAREISKSNCIAFDLLDQQAPNLVKPTCAHHPQLQLPKPNPSYRPRLGILCRTSGNSTHALRSCTCATETLNPKP
jgi:hypothetical protein